METDWNSHKGYLNGFSVQTQREALLRAIDSLRMIEFGCNGTHSASLVLADFVAKVAAEKL
jgi:hypothetical protein